MAHSAYPETGRVGDRQTGGGAASPARMKLPGDPTLGHVKEVGSIHGGSRAERHIRHRQS